jgi:RNA-directed DNA polymerase
VMASKHVGKKVVVSLDIKDFFHTIKQERLLQFYKSLGIGEAPARTLSELCTFKAFVPQGAITSPKVSNVITAVTFGPTVKAYCDGRGLTLTIYADDITMSSDDSQLDCGEVISSITSIVNQAGFRINTRKTKVMRYYNRQYVCGVVVNEKTNLIKRERLRLRAIVHNIKVNGPDHEALKNQTSASNFIDVLRGKINWYSQLNPNKAKTLSAELTSALKLHKFGDQERITTVSAVENVKAETSVMEVLPWDEPIQQVSVQAP